jgi:hypothetical protein
MELLKATAEQLDAALPVIGQKSFPGMSADEVDAFTLGFYAGAMAHELIAAGEEAPDAIAGRIEAEIKRIQQRGNEAT